MNVFGLHCSCATFLIVIHSADPVIPSIRQVNFDTVGMTVVNNTWEAAFAGRYFHPIYIAYFDKIQKNQIIQRIKKYFAIFSLHLLRLLKFIKNAR